MKQFLTFVFFISFCLSSCSIPKDKVVSKISDEYYEISKSQDWSYTGATGPNNWGNLNKEYAICSKGTQQSPINLTETIQKPLPLGINYHTGKFNIKYEKTTIKLIPENPSNTININGKNFNLKQLHFHTSSEHLINGKQSDLELHLVHEDATHALTVIGILVNKGSKNKEFQKITEFLKKENKVQDQIVTLNLQAFIPYNSKRVFYQGSLTTPPCTEDVSWIVFEKPIQFSNEQLQLYRKFYYPSSRPVQPINDRILYESW